MKKIIGLLIVVVFSVTVFPFNAYSDGCYICSKESKGACKDYCRYAGNDSAVNRKNCTKKGCKIVGTASCPSSANVNICSMDNGADVPIVGMLKDK